MMLIRPATLNDLDALKRLAVEAGTGMTTLPANRTLLAKKLKASTESFASAISEPGAESYLLVMEDTANGRVVGSSAIIAAVGLTRPFYSYKVINLMHTSRELNKYETVRVLQMVNEYRGTTEIATLYLTPDYRRDGNGKLLSRSRFMLMAEFPERFSNLVMAEIRGVHDERGHSVFWESLGRHFFDMEFSMADYLVAQGRHQFIADLMPKFPIYIRLLPKEAQAVIGVAHEASWPALELLKHEGFRFEGCVDVFDAGPTVHCPLEHIRTVAQSKRARIAGVEGVIESRPFMISTTRLDSFRVCQGNLRIGPAGTVHVTREMAATLGVQVGDTLRFVRF
jgi:arginine N-succinyltransferase